MPDFRSKTHHPTHPKANNHYKLLGADLLLIEWCTNLGAITKERVQIIALPLKIKGTEGAPARVVVVEED